MLDSESLNQFEQELYKRSSEEDLLIPAAITDPGCDRDLNEDRYAVIESNSGLMWLVCDGMGGVKGGELAAQLAIDAIKRHLDNAEPILPETAMQEAMSESNRVVVLRRQNQAFASMGTTAVAALFNDRQVTIANIGDSRAYLVSPDKIKLLTEDDTYVQQLVNSGEITLEESMNHPQAHVLTKALGSEPAIEFDTDNFWIWDIEDPNEQDYLILCSDGSYSMLTDDEIADFVRKFPPQLCCSQLVELAKKRGGYDNITVAVIPLVGKLRDVPPEGYKLQLNKPNANRNKLDLKSVKPMLIKNLLMIAGLSIIALIFSVVLILFTLSQ